MLTFFLPCQSINMCLYVNMIKTKEPTVQGYTHIWDKEINRESSFAFNLKEHSMQSNFHVCVYCQCEYTCMVGKINYFSFLNPHECHRSAFKILSAWVSFLKRTIMLFFIAVHAHVRTHAPSLTALSSLFSICFSLSVLLCLSVPLTVL